MFPWKHFEAAVKIASLKDDQRVHRLGAIGLRSDGVIVGAPNAPAPDKTPQAHAEARLCRKLDKGATVFVARKSLTSVITPCIPWYILVRPAQTARWPT